MHPKHAHGYFQAKGGPRFAQKGAELVLYFTDSFTQLWQQKNLPWLQRYLAFFAVQNTEKKDGFQEIILNPGSCCTRTIIVVQEQFLAISSCSSSL